MKKLLFITAVLFLVFFSKESYSQSFAGNTVTTFNTPDEESDQISSSHATKTLKFSYAYFYRKTSSWVGPAGSIVFNSPETGGWSTSFDGITQPVGTYSYANTLYYNVHSFNGIVGITAMVAPAELNSFATVTYSMYWE